MRTGFFSSGKLVAFLGAAVVGLASGSAAAQDQQPPAPPPGFAPPPAGYAPPAPGYAPPQGYAPPAGYAPPPGYYAPPGYGQPSLGPKVMDYDEGQPVPPGYHVETRVRKGLAIAGGVMFGTFYLFSAFGAAIASDNNDRNAWPFWVPAIGPFIALGTEKNTSLSHNDASSSLTFLYVLDGLIQTGGLAMFIAGIALPSQKLVRDDVGLLHDKVHIRPSPIALGHGQYGFGFVGTM
jgi:hypothetical protein